MRTLSLPKCSRLEDICDSLHSPSWSPVSMAYFIFVPFFRSNPSFPETWPLNSLLSLPTSAFSTFLVPARHNGQISSAKILLCLWHFLMQTFSLGVVVGLNQKNLMVPNAESCDCQPDVCTSDLPKESFTCMESECLVWGQALRLKKKKKTTTNYESFTSLYSAIPRSYMA